MQELRVGSRIDYLERSIGPSGLAAPAVIHAAHVARMRSAAWNFLLHHEQQRLLAELQRQGIQAFCIKGTVLALQVHQDVSAREVKDIDLAVQARDLAAAGAVLQREGYQACLPDTILQHGPFLAHATFKTAQANFVRNADAAPILVEMHWRLYPGEPDPWPVHAYAPELHSLAPTAMFFYMCVQLAARGWTDLHKLCDLGDFLLCFGNQIDSQEFSRLSRQSGQQRNVGISLELLAALFGFRWSEQPPDWRICEATQELLRRPFRSTPPGSVLAYHRERLASLDHWQGRLGYLRSMLRPSSEDYQAPGGALRGESRAHLRRWGRLAGLVFDRRPIYRTKVESAP